MYTGKIDEVMYVECPEETRISLVTVSIPFSTEYFHKINWTVHVI